MTEPTRRVFLEEIAAIAAMTAAAASGSVGIAQTAGVSSVESKSMASLWNLLRGKSALINAQAIKPCHDLNTIMANFEPSAISAAHGEHYLAQQLQSHPDIIEPLIRDLLEGQVGSLPYKPINAQQATEITQRVRKAFANIDPNLTLEQRTARWKQLYSDTLTQAWEAQQRLKERERSKLAEQPETTPLQPYLSDELQQYVDAVLATQGGKKIPLRPASSKEAADTAKWQKKMGDRDDKLPPTK